MACIISLAERNIHVYIGVRHNGCRSPVQAATTGPSF
uniref:Uncharacterized protein n=1 Tax=Zea mays TaxID=4577 RepID=B7ZZ91_MAIZE|nr:unknown [Zea mays]